MKSIPHEEVMTTWAGIEAFAETSHTLDYDDGLLTCRVCGTTWHLLEPDTRVVSWAQMICPFRHCNLPATDGQVVSMISRLPQA